MEQEVDNIPIVMCFSGSDPSGGAGIQADIETLASQDCHCVPIVTALTVQNTLEVTRFEPVAADLVIQQAEAVLRDMPVSAIKIGMLGSIELVKAIAELLKEHSDIPVVLDPVLQSGTGATLAEDGLAAAINQYLLPRVNLCLPNHHEAEALAGGGEDVDAWAQRILQAGCEVVLVTGADEASAQVVNYYYSSTDLSESFTWERLPAIYHGSGCTLAAAAAGLMGQGLPVVDAVTHAQNYVWKALRVGYQLGQGQYFPNRFYWARTEEVFDG